MAHVLKHDYGIDAIPAGHDVNSQETLDMLSDWADRIIVMQPHYASDLPQRNAYKIIRLNIGPDVWGNSLHPDLIGKVKMIARDLHEKGLIKKG